ncbi:MAG: alginate lyase family protein [Legionellaceae bacterium]|nr:alginate lyase family protein [Legionellaceae bacterium]
MKQKLMLRYIHTLRYLKFEQLMYQVFYRMKTPKLNRKVLHELSSLRTWPQPWLAPEVMPSASIDKKNLVFLGEEGCLDEDNLWNSPKRSKLWLYNLHYFDVMSAVGAFDNQDVINILLHRWIQENPPIQGNGWEPYPLSLRIVNWVKWFSKYPEYANEATRQSLALQGAALVKQLEYHILGNHLFANAKALVFIGSYFDGVDAASWLAKGVRLLDREIPEQFLLDGGHFERSPMYHATLLWDMCDLYNLACRTGIQALLQRKHQWKGVIQRGLSWLACMTHPDGDVSFFNDSTLGIAPKLDALEAYAKQLGMNKIEASASSELSSVLTYHDLKYTGYGVVDLPEQGKLIVDVGEVGPVYQPGHAHADTLSFELSLYGQRLFVNSGISCYGQSELREYQRSTQAHNTVCVSGLNSSETWAGFRVARRAFPKDLSIKNLPDQIVIQCSHDGYLRLPGNIIHQRTWGVTKNSLNIRDVITERYQEAEVRYYFHPEIQIKPISQYVFEAQLTSGQIVKIAIVGARDCNLAQSCWYPAFGISQDSYCLVIKFKSPELSMHVEW